MSERKNIDRLFQEKFKDFEANPSEVIWENIEAKLDEKKRRRVIPFWLKLSGVAAVFMIGFLIAKSIYGNGIETENSVVQEDSQKNNKVENAVEKGSENGLKNNTTDALKNSGDVAPNRASDNTIANSENNSVSKEKSNAISEKKKKSGTILNSAENKIAEHKSSNKRSLKNKVNPRKNNSAPPATALETENALVQKSEKSNSTNSDKNQSNEGVANNQKTPVSENHNGNNVNLNDLKGAINSNIATKENEKKNNDSLKIAPVVTNALEELLNEKESKSKVESKQNRWQIATNVAPIFLGSMSKGSPIDSTFADNGKDYNRELSLGIGVSYALNSKFSIRTGINKVSYDYNTNDIAFYADLVTSRMPNINVTANAAMIHVEDANTTPSDLLPFENAIVKKNVGYINQKMGYLEVPLEVTYAVINKKFGFKVISGFSTLLLNDNKVSLVSAGMSTTLGKANNLSEVHFSTNVGLGLKYSFWKSFEANVEPIFKYQINTFNANSGDFKPFIFGVYSGVSYKF